MVLSLERDPLLTRAHPGHGDVTAEHMVTRTVITHTQPEAIVWTDGMMAYQRQSSTDPNDLQ